MDNFFNELLELVCWPTIKCFQVLLFNLVHWLLGSVFANGPGDQSSISDEAIPKTKKNGS